MLLHSDIARLVLGYLAQEGCEQSFNIFLNESTHLYGIQHLFQQGYTSDYLQTLTVFGKTLCVLLNEYSLMKNTELNYLKSKTKSSKQSKELYNMWKQLEADMSAIKSYQIASMMDCQNNHINKNQMTKTVMSPFQICSKKKPFNRIKLKVKSKENMPSTSTPKPTSNNETTNRRKLKQGVPKRLSDVKKSKEKNDDRDYNQILESVRNNNKETIAVVGATIMTQIKKCSNSPTIPSPSKDNIQSSNSNLDIFRMKDMEIQESVAEMTLDSLQLGTDTAKINDELFSRELEEILGLTQENNITITSNEMETSLNIDEGETPVQTENEDSANKTIIEDKTSLSDDNIKDKTNQELERDLDKKNDNESTDISEKKLTINTGFSHYDVITNNNDVITNNNDVISNSNDVIINSADVKIDNDDDIVINCDVTKNDNVTKASGKVTDVKSDVVISKHDVTMNIDDVIIKSNDEPEQNTNELNIGPNISGDIEKNISTTQDPNSSNELTLEQLNIKTSEFFSKKLTILPHSPSKNTRSSKPRNGHIKQKQKMPKIKIKSKKRASADKKLLKMSSESDIEIEKLKNPPKKGTKKQLASSKKSTKGIKKGAKSKKNARKSGNKIVEIITPVSSPENVLKAVKLHSKSVTSPTKLSTTSPTKLSTTSPRKLSLRYGLRTVTNNQNKNSPTDELLSTQNKDSNSDIISETDSFQISDNLGFENSVNKTLNVDSKTFKTEQNVSPDKTFNQPHNKVTQKQDTKVNEPLSAVDIEGNTFDPFSGNSTLKNNIDVNEQKLTFPDAEKSPKKNSKEMKINTKLDFNKSADLEKKEKITKDSTTSNIVTSTPKITTTKNSQTQEIKNNIVPDSNIIVINDDSNIKMDSILQQLTCQIKQQNTDNSNQEIPKEVAMKNSLATTPLPSSDMVSNDSLFGSLCKKDVTGESLTELLNETSLTQIMATIVKGSDKKKQTKHENVAVSNSPKQTSSASNADKEADIPVTTSILNPTTPVSTQKSSTDPFEGVSFTTISNKSGIFTVLTENSPKKAPKNIVNKKTPKIQPILPPSDNSLRTWLRSGNSSNTFTPLQQMNGKNVQINSNYTVRQKNETRKRPSYKNLLPKRSLSTGSTGAPMVFTPFTSTKTNGPLPSLIVQKPSIQQNLNFNSKTSEVVNIGTPIILNQTSPNKRIPKPDPMISSRKLNFSTDSTPLRRIAPKPTPNTSKTLTTSNLSIPTTLSNSYVEPSKLNENINLSTIFSTPLTTSTPNYIKQQIDLDNNMGSNDDILSRIITSSAINLTNENGSNVENERDNKIENQPINKTPEKIKKEVPQSKIKENRNIIDTKMSPKKLNTSKGGKSFSKILKSDVISITKRSPKSKLLVEDKTKSDLNISLMDKMNKNLVVELVPKPEILGNFKLNEDLIDISNKSLTNSNETSSTVKQKLEKHKKKKNKKEKRAKKKKKEKLKSSLIHDEDLLNDLFEDKIISHDSKTKSKKVSFSPSQSSEGSLKIIENTDSDEHRTPLNNKTKTLISHGQEFIVELPNPTKPLSKKRKQTKSREHSSKKRRKSNHSHALLGLSDQKVSELLNQVHGLSDTTSSLSPEKITIKDTNNKLDPKTSNSEHRGPQINQNITLNSQHQDGQASDSGVTLSKSNQKNDFENVLSPCSQEVLQMSKNGQSRLRKNSLRRINLTSIPISPSKLGLSKLVTPPPIIKEISVFDKEKTDSPLSITPDLNTVNSRTTSDPKLIMSPMSTISTISSASQDLTSSKKKNKKIKRNKKSLDNLDISKFLSTIVYEPNT